MYQNKMEDTEVGTEVERNTKDVQPAQKIKIVRKKKWEDDGKKHRAYMLTLFGDIERWEEIIKNDNLEFYKYQIEKTQNGREHVQAYIRYKNARVWPKKKYPGGHIEPIKYDAAATFYVGKEKTRVRGPYQGGREPKQGERTDLEDIARAIVDGSETIDSIRVRHPGLYVRYFRGLRKLEEEIHPKWREEGTKPYITYIWGDTGVGKTRSIKEAHGENCCYIKDGTQWWDNYQNEEVIIVDDFDGRWPFRDLLRFLDFGKYQGQYKGGYHWINSKYIYFTTDTAPGYINEEWSTIMYDQFIRRLDRVIHLKESEKRKEEREGKKKAIEEEYIVDEDTWKLNVK